MKKIIKAVFLILSLTTVVYSQSINFYISKKGNDSWSGKIQQPNEQKTDGPFATFEKARDAIRDLKKTNNIQKGKIIINIMKGVYSFKNTLLLSEADGGLKDCPVIWKSYNNNRVMIIGGEEVKGFKKLTNDGALKRIDKSLHKRIFEVDLKKQGIFNYGQITPRSTAGLELFFDNKRMTLARFPDKDWLLIADIPQTGDSLYNKGLDREKRHDGVPVGRHYGKIKYDIDRPVRWKDTSEIFAHGYWTWDWSDSYQRIKYIDTKNKEVIFQEPHHGYGYTKKQRYYFVNILEELDKPGEWYLDRKTGLLYFYPPKPVNSAKSFVSLLAEPMIKLNGCNNVTIQGIHFQYSRGNGIVIEGGSDNRVNGCRFTNLGSAAVLINGGKNNGIKSCDICDLALNGIVVSGGDRKTLTPAGNYAENNHIHHYSEWVRTGMQGIDIHGVGNRLAHNLIHDAPHEGIYITGNDHLLEFNEIHDVCNETGDAGAIHTGRDYTWRGNVYRYNYFHHLKGPGLHGVTAIYWDDFTSGYTAYGNICFKSGRGALIGGGRDNVLENNIFIDCHPSIVLDARGLGWASYYFDGQYPWLFNKMKEMNADKPPYTDRYPELKTILNDQPAVPKNNKIVRNISYNSRFIDLLDYFAYDFNVITLKDNLIADQEICKRIKEDPKGWEPYYLNLDVEGGYRIWKNSDPDQLEVFKLNKIIKGDPGFVNYKKGDFRLKKDSPAYKLGFKPIPVEKIGLYIDEFRKSIKE